MPVTAEELHQAFWGHETGIAPSCTHVGDVLRESEGDQHATIDGEVNFSRLAEWINARMSSRRHDDDTPELQI